MLLAMRESIYGNWQAIHSMHVREGHMRTQYNDSGGERRQIFSLSAQLKALMFNCEAGGSKRESNLTRNARYRLNSELSSHSQLSGSYS